MAGQEDADILTDVQKRFEVQISEMPDEIDVATYSKNLVFLNIIINIVSYLVENR